MIVMVTPGNKKHKVVKDGKASVLVGRNTAHRLKVAKWAQRYEVYKHFLYIRPFSI